MQFIIDIFLSFGDMYQERIDKRLKQYCYSDLLYGRIALKDLIELYKRYDFVSRFFHADVVKPYNASVSNIEEIDKIRLSYDLYKAISTLSEQFETEPKKLFGFFIDYDELLRQTTLRYGTYIGRVTNFFHLDDAFRLLAIMVGDGKSNEIYSWVNKAYIEWRVFSQTIHEKYTYLMNSRHSSRYFPYEIVGCISKLKYLRECTKINDETGEIELPLCYPVGSQVGDIAKHLAELYKFYYSRKHLLPEVKSDDKPRQSPVLV